MLQPLEILEWKWEGVLMDFMIGLLRTQVRYDTFIGNRGQIDKIYSLPAY